MDSTGILVGSDQDDLAAAVANGATKTVTLTISGFVAGSVSVVIKAGTPVTFAPTGNGVLSHSVTAGTLGSGDGVFELRTLEEANTFNITHISVT